MDRVKIKLVSSGLTEKGTKTGTFKTTTKRSKPKSGGTAKIEKLAKKCYDPRAYNKETGKLGMHVEFKEDKIK